MLQAKDSPLADIVPGIYTDIPEDDYHVGPGVSTSMLKTFSIAPAKLRYGVKKESSALSMGSLIDCAVLSRELLDQRYVPTDLDRRGTKAWDAEAGAARGRELVKRPDWDHARRISDAVHRHPIGKELLGGDVTFQPSFYWIDEDTGLLCRGRADAVQDRMKVIIDLKSTVSAHPDDFPRSVAEYKYHWQCVQYKDGMSAVAWEPEAFVFIAVEKEPPYLVAAYEIDDNGERIARAQVRAQLRSYAECVKNDYWPGYSGTLERLSLPTWACKDGF